MTVLLDYTYVAGRLTPVRRESMTVAFDFGGRRWELSLPDYRLFAETLRALETRRAWW